MISDEVTPLSPYSLLKLNCTMINVPLKSPMLILLRCFTLWTSEYDSFQLRPEAAVNVGRRTFDNVVVTHDQTGSTHSWNWTSYLPLECATHSVWLRSRYNNQTSPWVKEKALPENQRSKRFEVYPRDGAFEAGSTATFCCILPAGERFHKMYLSGYNGVNMRSTRISNQTYALTLNLNEASNVCIDVKCKTNRTTYGACAFVGYPPGDKDLQCETQDLKSVECRWTVGRNTQFWSRTKYQLQGRPDQKRYSLQKTHQKKHISCGKMVIFNDYVHLILVPVRMFAPEEVTASTINSRNVSLKWRWTVDEYEHLNLTCESKTSGVGLNAAVLTDLMPNWTYEVTVRCRTETWRWGNWSRGLDFHTKGDVPDALDVWMQMKENQVVVVWKVSWCQILIRCPLENHHKLLLMALVVFLKKCSLMPNRSIGNRKLCLAPYEEHNITVTAWNINGSSSPSTVTTPNISPVNSSWITGSNGSFMLSWPVSPASSCGYIIDWCPTLDCQTVDWIKVPANSTNVTIFSSKDGLRYSLSIYACTEGAPVLLERREGIEEKLFKSLEVKQQEMDAEVSWEKIPVRQQPAFIRGFTLYYWNKDNTVFNVSTGENTEERWTSTNIHYCCSEVWGHPDNSIFSMKTPTSIHKTHACTGRTCKLLDLLFIECDLHFKNCFSYKNKDISK
uniref:Fibronectin type-III domain-containing protein n=1 Tax=Amphiprion ocellaris TaxID=80972 RepID=A0AAQ5YG55_AMPOC